MLKVNTYMEIGKWKFDYNADFDGFGSIDNLTETMTIKLPRKLSFEGKSIFAGTDPVFEIGDDVMIETGYDGRFTPVFLGYVRKINASTPVVLECEDEMYKLKQTVVAKQIFKNATLKGLLTDICPVNTKIEAVDISLGEIRIVSEKNVGLVLDEYKHDPWYLYSYFKHQTLYSGLAYWVEGRQEERFEFGANGNIVSEELQFSDAEDVKFFVKVIHIFPDNKRIHIDVGEGTGERRTFHYYNLLGKKFKDCSEAEISKLREQLKLKGEEEIKKMTFTGYRGMFTAFGEPVVFKGDLAKIVDPERPEREGSYLIKSVRRTGSYNGGLRQEIELDAKVS